jgi:DNA-directed RNA polymerase specialized sigma24 family protein
VSQTISTTRTTTRLLDDLRDPENRPAWAQIDTRFRPVIAGLARRLGVGESEGEEIAQQTLVEFVRVYRAGKYDRGKGRLSSWILGIAHHEVLRVFRRAGRTPSAGLTAIAETPDEPSLRSIWDEERDRTILTRAMGVLRDESDIEDKTLRAFELVGLRGVPAAEAASQCGLSVEQVYVAKNRVTKKLRALVADMTRAFEEDV